MATAPIHPAQVTVSVSKPAPAGAVHAPAPPAETAIAETAIAAPPAADVAGELTTLDSNLRALTGFGLAHWLAQLLSERYGVPAAELLPPASPST
jgi:hypothetical protein